jgi:hypothetical protein
VKGSFVEGHYVEGRFVARMFCSEGCFVEGRFVLAPLITMHLLHILHTNLIQFSFLCSFKSFS